MLIHWSVRLKTLVVRPSHASQWIVAAAVAPSSAVRVSAKVRLMFDFASHSLRLLCAVFGC